MNCIWPDPPVVTAISRDIGITKKKAGGLVCTVKEKVADEVTEPACPFSVMVYVPAGMIDDVLNVIDTPPPGMETGNVAEVVISNGRVTEVNVGVAAVLVAAFTCTEKLLLG